MERAIASRLEVIYKVNLKSLVAWCVTAHRVHLRSKNLPRYAPNVPYMTWKRAIAPRLTLN